MEQEKKQQLLEAIGRGLGDQGFGLEPERIPGIELYVDQIIAILGGEECQLTKTMVNNYTKDGLLKRIKGKKYSRQHVLMLLAIYHLKQSLTIQEIKAVFQGLEPHLDGEDSNSYSKEGVEDLTDRLLGAKRLEQELLPGLVEQVLEATCKPGGLPDEATAILALAELSSLTHQAAQQLIKAYYAPNGAK